MKRIPYILLLLALTLVGCHTTINYNGPTEPEKLVLHCEWVSNYYKPVVYLSHSFFMRQADMDSSYINDATVEFRIGDGEWQAMTSLQWGGLYRPEKWEVPQPGERVEIRASHPDYEPVSSVQYVPYPIEVEDCKINGIDKNGLISFSLTMSAYEGPGTDVVGFSTSGYLERTAYYGNKKSRKDTVHIETIYSLDPVFSRLSNPKSKAGYYGDCDHWFCSLNHCLYLPTDALREPRTIDFYADYEDSGIYGNATFTYRLIDDFHVDYNVGTEDYYRYNNSLRMYREETHLDDPHGVRMDDEYSDIEEGMNDIAYVLGGQEPVIIYNNIRGGIGHFTAYRQLGIYFNED